MGAGAPSLASPAKASKVASNGKVALTTLKGGNCGRIALATATQGVRLLTNPCPGGFEIADESPDFSPDGKRIVFVRDEFGATKLWIVRPDGTRHALPGNRSSTIYRKPIFVEIKKIPNRGTR